MKYNNISTDNTNNNNTNKKENGWNRQIKNKCEHNKICPYTGTCLNCGERIPIGN